MKLLKFVLFVTSLLVSISLVLGNLSPYVSPQDFWPLAFFGLAFPFVFIINFIFLLYWVILKHKKNIALPLIAFLLSLINIPSFIQINAKDTAENPSLRKLNVVSFNTHYMGAYDYNGGDSGYFFKILDKINPDVICLQEFANLGGNYEKPMFKRFFEQYKNFANVNADALSNTFPTGFGVCVFSKYPVINKGFLELENQNSNLTVFADILFGNDTIRIINTHLKSIVFDKEDYKTFEEIKEVEDGPDSYKVRRIISKLKYAFQYRAKQADKIRERLLVSPHKVVLCGDFNDSPTSFSYHTIRGKMKDAFNQSGRGMSRTYIGKMPSFRIDYILHNPSWNSYNYKTNTLNFSDHKMISCTIEIP